MKDYQIIFSRFDPKHMIMKDTCFTEGSALALTGIMITGAVTIVYAGSKLGTLLIKKIKKHSKEKDDLQSSIRSLVNCDFNEMDLRIHK